MSESLKGSERELGADRHSHLLLVWEGVGWGRGLSLAPVPAWRGLTRPIFYNFYPCLQNDIFNFLLTEQTVGPHTAAS